MISVRGAEPRAYEYMLPHSTRNSYGIGDMIEDKAERTDLFVKEMAMKLWKSEEWVLAELDSWQELVESQEYE